MANRGGSGISCRLEDPSRFPGSSNETIEPMVKWVVALDSIQIMLHQLPYMGSQLTYLLLKRMPVIYPATEPRKVVPRNPV